MFACRWVPEPAGGIAFSSTQFLSRPACSDTESLAFAGGDISRARNFTTGSLQWTLTPWRRFLSASSLEDSPSVTLSENQRWAAVKVKLGTIISNSRRVSGGFSAIGHTLGIDLGDSRTGVAVTLTGFGPRPLNVLTLKGEKLIDGLVQIAAKERADEFVLGLPISSDGKETLQSNKVRSFAGRLATRAAQRGWRVYLVDEFGSSQEGFDHMLEMGVKKRARRQMSDSYAAMAFLRSYFSDGGVQAHLVVPKGLDSQEKLCAGDRRGHDFVDEDYE